MAELKDFTGPILYLDAVLITVSDNGAHHSRTVNKSTVVSVDKAKKLSDLKVGDVVTLVGDPVTSINKPTKDAPKDAPK